MRRFLLQVKLFTAILLSIATISDAQKTITYQYQARYHSNSYNMILLMDGKGNSVYEKYLSFLSDSSDYANGFKQQREPNEKKILSNHRFGHEYRVIRTSESKQTLIGAIASQNYSYPDSINLFDWQLLDSQDSSIAGFLCRKAQCSYSGRVWTAWYATDIPISEGPYKFNGLPGLIVYVYDARKDFKIELFYFGNQESYLPRISMNKYIPISKKNFQKSKTNFLDNYLEYLKGNIAVSPNFKSQETIAQKWAKRPLSLDEVL